MVNFTTLDNGIRVITEHVPHVESVAIGVWMGAGAKNEKPDEYGLSHFLEHMLFKGTQRRTAKDIADEVASVGGQMNAATDREYTTYYIKVLKEFTPLAVDVLGDMVVNSTFDPEELEREKDVISEEIRRHEDLPEERVHDVLTEITWGPHELGHPVIGTEAAVRASTRDYLISFCSRQYTPERLVVSVAGNLDHNEITRLVDKSLGTLTDGPKPEAIKPVRHINARKIVDKGTEAAHFCIGAPGYNERDDRKYTLAVLDAILGGGMSSRLFQEIREKRGLAYDIGSYRVAYHEGGLFAVYGGTGVSTLGDVTGLVRQEFRRIREEDISAEELRRAQNQIRGAMILAHESMGSRMGRMAKSILDYGRLVTIEEIMDRVNSVTIAEVRAVAEELLQEDKLSMAVIGPADAIEKVLTS